MLTRHKRLNILTLVSTNMTQNPTYIVAFLLWKKGKKKISRAKLPLKMLNHDLTISLKQ